MVTSDTSINGLDSDLPLDAITMKTNDGKKITIEKKYLGMSGYLQGMLNLDAYADEIEVNTSYKVMKKIQTFIEYHFVNKFEIKQCHLLTTSDLKGMMSAWDIKYLDIPKKDLIELVNVSHYMMIEPLVQAGCAKIAYLLKGKTEKQIRRMFNIKREFSRKDFDEVHCDYLWALDPNDYKLA